MEYKNSKQQFWNVLIEIVISLSNLSCHQKFVVKKLEQLREVYQYSSRKDFAINGLFPRF